MVDKETLINEFNYMGNYIYNKLNSLVEINLNDLNIKNTILIIVDMNNGFSKKGNLYSERIEKLINPITNLAKNISDKNGKILCFSDSHEKNSPEFSAYPEHCLTGDKESEIINELKDIKNIEIIKKNSTNGFLANDFKIPSTKKNFIIVGNCTDICIYQFAITLKKYFDETNRIRRIIVPFNLVNTFESNNHKANFFNYVFLNSMIDNGIEVAKLNIN